MDPSRDTDKAMKRWFLYSLFPALLSSCVTTEPVKPTLKVDYVGNNVFRWGSHEGYSLLSFAPSGMPTIQSGGSFTFPRFELAVSEDEDSEKRGTVLPDQSEPVRAKTPPRYPAAAEPLRD